MDKIPKTLHELAEKLPKFPDGRIDYTKSNTALVIVVFVKIKDRILLLKRSEKVGSYQNKWHTVAGYWDEPKPLEEKIFEELDEELSVHKDLIESLYFGKSYTFKDKKSGKSWIVHPALVTLSEKPEIKLDWEHTEFRWIRTKEWKNFDTVPNFERSLTSALKSQK